MYILNLVKHLGPVPISDKTLSYDDIIRSFETAAPNFKAIRKRTPISRWALRWRHNGPDSVSNHQPHHCLLNRLFRRRSKKTSKLRVTGLCVGNSPGTGGFPAQMASNAENVSIWWRLHRSVFSNHFEIWQAARQHCRSTYQIWKQFEHYNLTGSKL